jgi:hypothetical protein
MAQERDSCRLNMLTSPTAKRDIHGSETLLHEELQILSYNESIVLRSTELVLKHLLLPMLACDRDLRDVVDAVDHFVGAPSIVLSFPPLLL